jgi:transposase
VPLHPDRARAANLIAAGHTHAETASALGVHKATVTRWAQTAAFKEAAERLRAARGGERTEPRAVPESCLAATDPGGHPAWAVRLRAAERLLAIEERERGAVGGSTADDWTLDVSGLG